MTNPIIECVQATGLNIYRIAKNRITGQTGNQNTPGWEVFNPANWLQYAVPLVEDGVSGYYHAARPAWEAGSLVTDVFYTRVGGSPDITDAPPFNFLHGEGENVAAINADPAVAPQNLAAALATELQGAVSAGTISNSAFPTNLGALANNLIVGRTLIFLSGVNRYAAAAILSYNGGTGVIGVSPFVAAPSVSDQFIIV